MKCVSCGKDLSDSMKVCPYCGAPQPAGAKPTPKPAAHAKPAPAPSPAPSSAPSPKPAPKPAAHAKPAPTSTPSPTPSSTPSPSAAPSPASAAPTAPTEDEIQREKDKRLGIGAALVSGAVAAFLIYYFLTNPNALDSLFTALSSWTVTV